MTETRRKPKYICFDPGGSTKKPTTGYATFDAAGQDIGKGQFTLDQLFDFLTFISDLGKDAGLVFIVEDYLLDPNRLKGQLGTRLHQVRVIGALQLCARITNAKFVLQPSSILSVATKWSGVPMPRNHDVSHWVSAYNHGIYYLVSKKIRKSRLQMHLQQMRENASSEEN